MWSFIALNRRNAFAMWVWILGVVSVVSWNWKKLKCMNARL